MKSLSHEKEFPFKGNGSQFRHERLNALGLDLKEEAIDTELENRILNHDSQLLTLARNKRIKRKRFHGVKSNVGPAFGPTSGSPLSLMGVRTRFLK